MDLKTEFSGKVVIITGGGSGIGDACVGLFLERGAKVLSVDIEQSLLDYQMIIYKNYNVATYCCDMSDHVIIKEMINYAVALYGRIDCIVNNVGYHPPVASIGNFSVDEFDKLIKLNLISTYAMCSYSYNELKKTKGTIINVSSMVGLRGQSNAVAYCASKAGQLGLTKALAIDAGRHGIRVNAVCPSNVMTPAMINWANTFENPDKALDMASSVQKLNRMAEPLEIARTIYFLASDESSFITGTVLEVDGGAYLGL
jgi:L-fucose dehydrogenase